DQATIAYAAGTGAQQWVSRYDSPDHGWDYGTSITARPDGTTVYTGGATSRSVGSRLTYDYLTTSMSAGDGSGNWASVYNGPGDYFNSDAGDQGNATQVSPGGDGIYVTGNSYRASSSFDITSVAYDATGSQVWLGRY